MDDTRVLAEDMRRLVDDAEALLQHAVQGTGQEYTKARHRLEQSLLAAKGRMGEMKDAAFERGRDAAKASDEYVRRHPWESIGVAAAVGVALGLLIGRR
jgi:ElaB/YqjD/DUF883 family membrane-anchored ribosome-binding protein